MESINVGYIELHDIESFLLGKDRCRGPRQYSCRHGVKYIEMCLNTNTLEGYKHYTHTHTFKYNSI